MKDIKRLEDLKEAYDGSYYTIAGAGGDLNDWVNGMEKELAKSAIGEPVAWFTTTGHDVNEFAHPGRPQDAFQEDLTFLMFPLDGLDVSRLAMFKMAMGDRWFDDVIDNMQFWQKEE